MIRVVLPYHLRMLARVDGEVSVPAAAPPTWGSVVDALETCYPALRGTVRDPHTGRRRPLVRFFACGEDISAEPADAPLPQAVAGGEEPLLIVGAIAGG